MTLRNSHHAAIHNALETINAIQKEPAVVEMAGYAYWTNEVEIIQKGIEALKHYEPNATSHVARYQNDQKLTLVGRALNMADILLEHRSGLQELKNAVWTDHDQQVIKAGMEAFQRATIHQRN